jgi:hypothetical protein
MNKFLKQRLFKYIIYFIVVLFIALNVPSPHDKIFFKMIIGLIMGHFIFSFWLLDFRWYICIMLGFVIPTFTIYFSYSINILLFANNDRIILPELTFFILFVVISLFLWEGSIKLTNVILKRKQLS